MDWNSPSVWHLIGRHHFEKGKGSYSRVPPVFLMKLELAQKMDY